tara:strand:+ start:488 stop:691 length:204 start_codon:yes stop_codon:yes gene_type:complete
MVKIYIEDTKTFKKKLIKELRDIDNNKAKILKEDSISFQSLDQLRKFLKEIQKPKHLYVSIYTHLYI